jgi:hypothetical protein
MALFAGTKLGLYAIVGALTRSVERTDVGLVVAPAFKT